ncbi:MAG: DPP IV N-terminal domain-containing protein, partial [Vicinamibacterales bacterium]
AGDPNPTARLGIVPAKAATPIWMDASAYTASDFLIVNVDWTPDSRQVVQQVQNREQTWLDLNLVDSSTGRPRTVLRETTKAWVNENGNPAWLANGSFLWISERTGFRHVYQYRSDGSLVRQITNGSWEVRTLYGADEQNAFLYFSSGERSALGEDVYRMKIDGTGLTRLSQAEGTHRANFNRTFTQYIDVWSDVSTPPQVRLHRADGREVRAIDENRSRALAEYRLARPEHLKVTTRDGFVMDAVMIKPPDFDPARRYPVYQFTYAGPTQSVARNRWDGSQYMFHQLLAQHGVIVWLLDNRSASGKGVMSQWPVYGRLGELELQDLEDGIAWLKRQPY